MAQEPELPKDWLEFMQKMWNPMSFPMPGMTMPTVDVEEVERKIAELKAVETWLTMNVGFVQMTVKTLEMQKASAAKERRTSAAAGRSGCDGACKQPTKAHVPESEARAAAEVRIEAVSRVLIRRRGAHDAQASVG